MPPLPQFNRRSALALFGAFAADAALAPTMLRAELDPNWTTPMPPFRIAGNLHYVGSRDLASYLITTPKGHILINSNLVTSPVQIRASIEKLGFHFRDVKILLISHAHYDHCAGSAEIKKLTGAKYMVMDADVSVVESGGRTDFQYATDPTMHFPATKVDRALHDGETIQFGGIELTAHRTPGHTKGCTTWTMTVEENGKNLNAVIVGSPNVNPGYKLVDNPKYPEIASDYAQGFRTLNALPCDIFLGAHGLYFDLQEKYARKQAGDAAAFVDPSGYKAYIADRQQAFEAELARQKKARPG
jgi:metallo-beta-lactamase class B